MRRETANSFIFILGCFRLWLGVGVVGGIGCLIGRGWLCRWRVVGVFVAGFGNGFGSFGLGIREWEAVLTFGSLPILSAD